MTTSRFLSVAPIIPVRDLAIALARYAALGFMVNRYDGPEAYGFVERGGVELHLTETPGHDPLTTDTQVYLRVSDADAVHAQWSAAGAKGRFTEPAGTPYGLREFAYVDPDGTAHRVDSPGA